MVRVSSNKNKWNVFFVTEGTKYHETGNVLHTKPYVAQRLSLSTAFSQGYNQKYVDHTYTYTNHAYKFSTIM